MKEKKLYQTHKSKTYHFIFILVVLMLISCAPTYHKMYSGPTLPKEQVTFLITEHDDLFGYESTCVIKSVDGKKLTGGWVIIELLPGYHTISIGYYKWVSVDYHLESTKDISLKFKAEAGRTYLAYVIRENTHGLTATKKHENGILSL